MVAVMKWAHPVDFRGRIVIFVQLDKTNMTMKRLLLGDEAIALGALYAGLSGVYAYPGTPSTEITEFIQNDPLARERGVRSRWCTNAKTAMEAALGTSYAGKRAQVCTQHAGMTV